MSSQNSVSPTAAATKAVVVGSALVVVGAALVVVAEVSGSVAGEVVGASSEVAPPQEAATTTSAMLNMPIRLITDLPRPPLAAYRNAFLSHPVGTISAMARIHVEGWAPEYGSPVQTDESLADEDRVDETVEVVGTWDPLPGTDDGIAAVAFVDGVRRIDARLALEDGDGPPVAGICGTYAVGSVLWDRTIPAAEVTHAIIDRVAIFGNGKAVPMPPMSAELIYRTESIAGSDPAGLIQSLHGQMRKAEATLSEDLAKGGVFVVADGPINDLSATEKVGFIKTHRRPYLSDDRVGIVGALGTAERTPLFLIGAGGAYPRYSWYFRLATIDRGHAWSGIARAEVSSHLDLATAQRIADRVTAIVPAVASEPHIDPRAPQNLVPIAALERELRRRMGDPAIVYRALRAATLGGVLT